MTGGSLTDLKGLVPLRSNGVINFSALRLIESQLRSKFHEAYPNTENFTLNQVAWHIKNSHAPIINVCKCGSPLPFTGKGYKAKCQSCADDQRVKRELARSTPKVDGRTLPQANERRKSTSLERYGVEFAVQTADVKQRTRETNEARYGTVTWSASPDGKTKLGEVLSAHHREVNPDLGVLESMSDHQLVATYGQCSHNFQVMSQALGVSSTTLSREFRQRGLEVKQTRTSTFEHEVGDYVSSLGVDVERNAYGVLGGRLELDIYVPSRNFAIEANGVYWHSFDRPETPKEKNRHNDKRLACKSLGIDLLQITEIEWQNQKELLKSMIRARLGILSRAIYARKCTVENLTGNNALIRKFLTENHIQGWCGARETHGLLHEGELVAVMSFGKPRYALNYDWELIRFAVKQDLRVVGAGSKLLAAFRRGHTGETLISYSNNMKFSGKVYQRLGFQFSHTNAPGYQYTDCREFFSRVAYQKHKLPVLFGEGFNPQLSESENCFKNGLRRYWDCGTDVWSMTL